NQQPKQIKPSMIARRRGKNDRAVSDLLAESQLTKSIKSRATFLDITPRTLETWRKKGLTPYIRIAGRAVGCVFLRNDIHRKGLYYDDFPGREQRLASIFSITRPRCALTVRIVIPNSYAICLLSRPETTWSKTSCSRGVKVFNPLRIFSNCME